MFSRRIGDDISAELTSKLSELLTVLESHRNTFIQKIERLNFPTEEGSDYSRITTSRGRPKLLISEEQVVSLKSLGMSWTKIAELLGVSTKTLRRGYGNPIFSK